VDPERVDLTDPDVEPTDEQLQSLSKRAFAHVARENAEALARLHASIAEGRRALLGELAEARKAR
jgi:hypothetical protein